MNNTEKAFEELSKFKSLMITNVSYDKAKYIWGKETVRNWEFQKVKKENGNIEVKTKLALGNVKFLLLGNIVKFIGLSGSVAAGFAKEDDDIDVFIVVRNDTAWIYRAILVFRNIFYRKIRTKLDGSNVKDKFCLNFICEERDVTFENDIFNFHELMYLIPIYNEKFLNYIYSQNLWLREEYGVKKELLLSRIMVSRKRNIFLRIINFLAFFAQLVFMFVTQHNPEVRRLKENFKKGRIAFFPGDYKRKKIDNYLK